MYKGIETEGRMTRTLEIHEGDLGSWYFTVHEGTTLLHSSHYDTDRIKITVEGIEYLDHLNLIDYKLHNQKGINDGQ